MAMEKKYLIISDIHGNVSAFNSVISDCKNEEFNGVIILGDCIDYGMRSNEIISKLIELEDGDWAGKIIVNIWGNHEKLIIDKELDKLSSDRGRIMVEHTAKHLLPSSVDYIQNSMCKYGKLLFNIDGMRCLAIHGSEENCFWKAIEPKNLRGEYDDYDIVFSGHSHYSHCFTYFYDVDDEEYRNKKAVMFLNPGSVGQPRNQNPRAQYAVLSLPSKRVELRAIEYDVLFEQSLYTCDVDEFYKNRLSKGI